jgi:hypothetical protein
LLVKAELIKAKLVEPLMNECDELLKDLFRVDRDRQAKSLNHLIAKSSNGKNPLGNLSA